MAQHFLITFILAAAVFGLSSGQQDKSQALQDHNFFYGQAQGRFIPTFQDSRNGFFPSLGTRNTAPGSYQDRQIFLANSNQGSSNPSSFFQYSNFPVTTRRPDIFEISPRPFSFTDDGFQVPFTKGPTTSLRSDFYQPPTSFGGSNGASQSTQQFGGRNSEESFQDQLNVQYQNTLPSRGRTPSNTATSSRVKPDPFTSQNESNNGRNVNRNSGSRFRTTAAPRPSEPTTAATKPSRNMNTADRGTIKAIKTATRGPVRDLVPLTEPSVQTLHTVNISHNGSNKQRSDDDDYYNEAIRSSRPLEDESKFYSSPKNNVEKDQREDIDEIESSKETNKDVEAHTVILTDNFFLPPPQHEEEKKEDEEEPEYEYEYEYVEETDEPPVEKTKEKEEIKQEPAEAPQKEEPAPVEEDKEEQQPPKEQETEAPIKHEDEQEVPEPTKQEEEEVPPVTKTPVPTTKIVVSTEPNPPPKKEEEGEEPGNTTESWVVVASVQTSRSVSGARFLPFPQVKQEEKKAPITELDSLIKTSEEEKKEPEKSDEEQEEEAEPTPETVQETTIIETTTSKPLPSTVSTESINDKLDSIQSELSSGVLSGQFPVLKEMTTEEATKAPAVFIRKFSPRTRPESSTKSTITTTTSSTTAVPSTTQQSKKITVQDDLTGLLPADFKPRYTNFKNKKTTTTTTESTTPEVKIRNVNNTRSFFKNDAPAQDLDIKSKITYAHDDSSKFLPKDYTSEKPKIRLVDDVSRFLPPGYKAPIEKPVVKVVDDVSKFLPPGYKSSEKPPAVIPLDEIARFLPPGYKPESTTKIATTIDDISKLLPPGYNKPESEETKPIYKKPSKQDDSSEEVDKFGELLTKIKFKEVSDLVPKDFKPTPEEPETTTKSGFVFPKRPGGNKEAGLPAYKLAKGPPPPKIEIKRGPPTRATTEFTGWPTVSTTPISIEKLLQQSGGMKIDLASLFTNVAGGAPDVPGLPVAFIPTQPDSPFTSPTTTTTSTTTTTVRPTEPGICQSECDLAGTIRIVDGVKWKPELLDHNTDEWKNLAIEVKQELNDVFVKSAKLRRWYKTMRIDSFSKGSVLVDYFVELNDIPETVNTLQIKQMFHDALSPAPTPENDETAGSQGSAVPHVKETFLLGKFVVDPVSTDFIVQPKSISPTGPEEPEEFLPQWAIAVIVMSFVSLLFVILFGVAVLVNRQKAAKKKGPAPLTAAMLNELNKNHMGGLENYGNEELYNVDDGWGEEKEPPYSKHEFKSKRLNGSIHGSSATNIYDSWRSTRNPTDYYQDHYDPYSYNKSTHSRDYMMHEPPAVYPYSKQYDPYSKFDPYKNYEKHDNHRHSRRFYKDYDPNF